ncbi:hypothetical protein Tco_0671569 [Tanacetum coccineum]
MIALPSIVALSHGFDQHYTTWKYHGEPILPLPPQVPHSPEHVAEEALPFCSHFLKDDVETRFNRLGRNDDGLPEEEPNKFQLTGRIKATRLTTDVRQAVVWFVLNNSPKVDADILAYREKSPDNVETNFPAWFNHKVVEHVYHRDVAESDQDVKMVAKFHQIVTTVCNAEDDDVAHVLDDDDDDDVVVSDDDEVNPSTNVEEFFYPSDDLTDGQSILKIWRAYFLDHTVGMPVVVHPDGPTGPYRPSAKVPDRVSRPGTLHEGDYASMLNSLMGETVRYLPFACARAISIDISPLGTKIRINGDGAIMSIRLGYRKVWGDRTEDEWNKLVDWWSHPDRVARSLQNAANRAKNTILTIQEEINRARHGGRNEYKVQNGHYEDLIELEEDHSSRMTGEFKTEKNRKARELGYEEQCKNHVEARDICRTRQIRYLGLKSFQYQPKPTAENKMSGKGRKLPGGGSNSAGAGPSGISRCYKSGGAGSDIEAKRSRGRVVKEANRGGATTGLFGCIEGYAASANQNSENDEWRP